MVAYHARGARNDVFGGDVQFLRNPPAGRPRVVHAPLAGGYVGILAVDYQSVGVFVSQVLAAYDDRGPAEQALGKHAHRRGPSGRMNYREVQGFVLDADILGNAQKALRLKG